MAITNAQQARQLYKNGKRVGLFRGAQADASAGRGSMSPGTSGGGGSREGGYGRDQGNQGDQRGDLKSYSYDRSKDTGPNRAELAAANAREKARLATIAEQKKLADIKAKAIADKKAEEAKAKEEKKEAKAKAKRDKKTKQIRTKAFKEFQKLDPYAVEEMGMYGYTPEQIAAGKHLGPVDLGTKKSALGKDSIYDDGQANELEVLGNIAGYDLTGLPMGRTTLTSNKGTSLEKTKANPYGLRTKTGIPSIDLLGGFMNPDDQIGAINTLNDARNIQDLGKRFADGDDSAYEEYEDYISRNIPTSTGGGGGDNNQTYVPPIIATKKEDDTTDDDTTTPNRNLGGLAPRFAGSIFDFTGLADGGIARAGAMDGGRMMMMANEEEDDPVGGIMDLESVRDMYFVGGLVKSAKKAVKGVTRAVKKIAKSPIGKAALLYAGGTYLGGLSSLGGSGTFMSNLKSGKGIANLLNFGKTKLGFDSIMKGGAKQTTKGLFSSPFGLITAGSLLAGAMTPKEEEENNDDYYKNNKLDMSVRYRPFGTLMPSASGSMFAADGGLMRTGYAEGSEEPVAKKTMPLLDMDGQEMDLREEGGFVPLGRMERADDVPARLSKNEFVFTADAVRNAGEGDIDKGAEVMYNMMKNLESGGEVSEESQGLEGAREMFKTSQRLEEVI